eukprot:2215-Heterococcus_DN1.PRE.2
MAAHTFAWRQYCGKSVCMKSCATTLPSRVHIAFKNSLQTEQGTLCISKELTSAHQELELLHIAQYTAHWTTNAASIYDMHSPLSSLLVTVACCFHHCCDIHKHSSQWDRTAVVQRTAL